MGPAQKKMFEPSVFIAAFPYLFIAAFPLIGIAIVTKWVHDDRKVKP